MALRLLRLEELSGHDVYELAYAHIYRENLPFAEEQAAFWRPENRYLTDNGDGRGIDALAPSLDRVFEGFAYLAPQRVTLAQWARVEQLHRAAHPEDAPFFQAVAAWLEQGNRGADYFWILGY